MGCTQYTSNFGNSEVAAVLEKISFHSDPKEGQCQRMFKLVLEKAEEPEIKLPTSAGSWKKQESSRKTSTSAHDKDFDCVDHNKLWKILKEMGIPDHLTCLLRNVYAGQEATVRTGHGTTDWFQMEKEYVKAVYCHPAYLTSMQSTS